jgi:hypothetical protein
VADSFYLRDSNNLSDVASAATARTNLGVAAGLVSVQPLASAAPSITFSAIPGGYNLLRLLVIGASADAVEADRWLVTVNGDGGTHYDLQAVYGVQSTASANVKNAQTGWLYPVGAGAGDLPGASAASGVAGLLDVQIPLYAGTVFQKVGHWRSGYSDAATSGADQVASNAAIAWRSVAAITSITVASASASNLVTGTTALLYLS